MQRYWLCLLLVLWPCMASAEWFTNKQSIMGTEISLTFWTEQPQQAPAIIKAVMEDMRWVDNTFSPSKTDSELYRVNATAAVKPVVISNELYKIIEKALHYSVLSAGAFDITFASVGFYYNYRQHQQPSDAKLQQLLPAINYRHLVLNPSTKTLFFAHPNVKIDLGGIAKGYAVDRAADILQKMGVQHATISAGGDSRILGDKLGETWRVGIKNPRPKNDKDAVITLLPLSDSAISTSGDYERYFFDDKTGQRIHHIINPKTGKSASEIISVSVMGPKGFDTDPLTKCVWILGVKDGLKLINSLPQFDAVVIDKNGTIHYSQGLETP